MLEEGPGKQVLTCRPDTIWECPAVVPVGAQ